MNHGSFAHAQTPRHLRRDPHRTWGVPWVMAALFAVVAMMLPGLAPASFAEGSQSGQTSTESNSSGATGTTEQATPTTGSTPSARSAQASTDQFLRVSKSVDGSDEKQLEPGQSFTYQIDLNCSEQNCVNATMSDALPPQLAGFKITGVETTPASVGAVATWTEGGATVDQPATVGADTTVAVSLHQSFPGGSGLAVGTTAHVNITLQVPNDFSPDDSRNGVTITNTATSTADNSADDSDSADVVVSVDESVAAAITKDWAPATATFDPTATSTIRLRSNNASNVAVDTLTVQEPQASDAPDGANSLSQDNPFRITDFTGFGNTTKPAGASTVQVDAYVEKSDGTWAWVTGTAGPDYALPTGVTAGQVGGLRFTYTGTIAPGAGDDVQLNLVQRSTDRNDGSDLSTKTSSVDNVAQAQTAKGSTKSDVATDDATYKVSPAGLGTDVEKSFSPYRIPAGNTTTGTITAKNTQSPVKTLTISDTSGFFTDTTTFTGFTAPIAYPEGATSGTVTYHLLGGGTEVVPFDSGAKPTVPSGKISGFDIFFSADTNSIITNGQTTVQFGVATSSRADFGDKDELTSTNTATSEAEAANGQSVTDSDDADLTIVKPSINVTLDKNVKPSDNVEPGQSVVADLKSTTSASSDYVKPTKIVVEDSWGTDKPESGFWNAFNLTSIQPTQVPAGASLQIEVQKSDGTWITLDTASAQDAAWLYQLDADSLAGKLPSGVSADSLTGIRFTFAKNADDPFPSNTTVRPYIAYTARATTRTGNATDKVDGTADEDGNYGPQSSTKYTNAATTTGTGTTNDGTDITGKAADNATTGIIVEPTWSGVGPAVHIGKAWDRDSVASQSGGVATTHLNWRVSNGITQVTITDPAGDPSTTADTVFNAFDLTAINGIAVSGTPYTNGWFLKYDTVQSVELFRGGAWQTVTAPGGTWQEANGSFKGYTLSATEKADTTGVRIILVPNDTARTAALAAGTDPYAPAPGSGVVASSSNRTFDLVWQLRNTTRSDDSFITGKSELNAADSGVVDNSVTIDGTSAQGTRHDKGDDTIGILDQEPAVAVTKDTAAAAPIQVPAPGTVPADQYPTNSYTLTAHNASVTRASYVRVTDPTPCDDTALPGCESDGTAAGALANPFLGNDDVRDGVLDTDPGTPNPFNRQDITKITIGASIADEVDLSASKVWLLEFTPGAPGSETGAYSYVETTAAQVNAMNATDLAKVVGISVAFQGSDPAVSGGTISQGNNLTIRLDTRVRATLRTTGANFIPDTDTLKTSKNRVFAQSYDPVTAEGTKTGDTDDATVDYTSGSIDVNPGKTITPGTITVVDPKAPQTVTLSATQGSSTVSPKTVTITDQPDGDSGSTDFWTNFDFTGLSGITFPAGATQVVVSAYGPFGDDGAMSWKDGAAQASNAGSFTVPVDEDQYSQIQGLRFTFTKADGTLFSTTTPNWSAGATYTVVLRDTVRGSDAKVAFPGDATNMVSAVSEGALDKSDEKSATAGADWTPGTAYLAIDKLANDGTRSASIGSMVPWDITIRNTGTGYLDLTKVVDTLPAALRYTGSGSPADPSHPVQFTAGKLSDGSAGSLTTAPAVDASDAGQLVFTWPQGESRMQPGETAVIRVWLELQPGPQSGHKVVNNVSVFTEQKLDGVSDAVSGNGAGPVTPDGSNGAKTSDYVSPTSGENLYVVKGVKGSLDGAVNTLDPSQDCTASLTGADGQSYYRSPCAANSTVNGTDQWILHMVNAGTTDVLRAQFFDQLPVQGDKYLVASGTDRGTQYRPQILDDLKVVGAPAGTTTTIEVTSDANACVGTWGSVPAAPNACGDNSWSTPSTTTDWTKVTGIRVTLDFTTSTAGALKPGSGADVTYSSRNEPQTAADASGASTDVPATDQFAWNQFGLLYTGADTRSHTIAPSVVGVHLRTGSIEVAKKVTGSAASYAPDSFTAEVACTIPAEDGKSEVPLTFDGAEKKLVTLTKNQDGTYGAQRVPGIPVGASCTVAETGEVGHFGETTRDPADSVTLQVTAPDTYASGTSDEGEPTNDVPSAQISTLTNDYQWSGLEVTKKVDTQATTGTFGPFDFEVSCTTADGQVVKFGDDDSTTFTLTSGQTWKAPENTIPARSDCTITETDSDKADSTVITGDNVTPNEDGSATVNVGTDPAEVVSTLVTNHYDAGTFTVTKKSEGSGADVYGAGPFTFQSTCTYNGQTLLDETYTLDRDGSKTFGIFPAGTECSTVETKSAGATATAMDPADGKVTIARQAAEGTPSAVSLTATNTFDSGDLRVVKKVDGAGAEKFGVGPFTAQVVCTYDKDGVETPVGLVNGGKVTLDQANGYSATLTNIIKGAECTVTETDQAGADSSALSPSDGTVTIGGQQDDPVGVTITNTFEAGYVAVQKKVEGEGAEAYGSGPYSFTAVCTWPEGTGAGGAGGSDTTSFTLQPSDDESTLSERLGLYPVGTECEVTETDAAAATSTQWDPSDQKVTVKSPGDPSEPSEVTVTATNTFDVATLEITKVVTGAGAADFGVGPFTAQVACTYQKSGKTLDVDLPDNGVVTLSEDNGYKATLGGILKGSTCTVEETGLAGADSGAITGDGVTVDDQGMATLVVGDGGADSAAVTITNTFKAGYVTVTKAVEGDGAVQYGSGDFSFTAVCTFPQGSGVAGQGGSDEQEFTLKAGESKQLGLYPVGTECQVTETKTGGATSSALSPVDGKVTVADSEDPEVASDVTVAATNTFDTGSVKIVKKRIGIGVKDFGDGPFQAQVACTYQKDGETTDVVLPDGGKVTLSKANGYTATVVGIITGADCTVTETKDGGADKTSMSPADGKVSVGNASAGDGPVVVTITNEFNTAKPGNLPKTGAEFGYLSVALTALLLGGAFVTLRKRNRWTGRPGARH